MGNKESRIENLKNIMFIGKDINKQLNDEKKIKQEKILNETYEKCIEIKEMFSFLIDYGFTIEIFKTIESDYGEYYNYFINCIKLSRGKNKVHFAILYPITKGDYDFSSYQLSSSFGCKFYTYESGIKDIRKLIFNCQRLKKHSYITF